MREFGRWLLTPQGFICLVVFVFAVPHFIRNYIKYREDSKNTDATIASSKVSVQRISEEKEALKRELNALYDEVNPLKLTIDQKEARIQELTHTLDTVYEQVNACRAECKSKDKQLQELRDQNSIQEITLKNTNQKYREVQEILKEFDDYKEGYDHSKNTIQQLKRELSEQKEKYVLLCDALSKEKEQLLQEAKKLECSLKTAISNERSPKASIREFQATAEQLKRENSQIRANLSKLEGEKAFLEKRITELLDSQYTPQTRLDYLLDLQRPENELLRRGLAYELQVGKWYEDKGFFVLYSGIVMGMSDHGIDLVAIPPSGDRALIIQCKNYNSSHPMEHRHVRSFMDSVAIYNRHHLINDKPILAHTSATRFEIGIKEELQAYGVRFNPIEFDPNYLNGLYGNVDKIRLEQECLFFDAQGNDILKATIQYKLDAMRKTHISNQLESPLPRIK